EVSEVSDVTPDLQQETNTPDEVAPDTTPEVEEVADVADVADVDAPDTAPEVDEVADVADVGEVDVSEVVGTPKLALAGPGGAIVGGVDDAGEQTPGVPFVRTYVITNTGDATLHIDAVRALKAAPLNCDQ